MEFPNLDEMIITLRNHFKLAHVDTTFKARSLSLSAWLKQELEDKKEDG